MAPKTQDTYFFDAEAAYETAVQNNTVEVSPGWHLKQVCYYHEPVTNPPENLINVILDDIVDFFHHATEKPYTRRALEAHRETWLRSLQLPSKLDE